MATACSLAEDESDGQRRDALEPETGQQWAVSTTIIRLTLIGTTLLMAGALLTACNPSSADASRGAQLFSSLPCSGCHGAQAQGQFGPALAGTDLTLAQVRRQVRSPRDRMPAFDEATVSDGDLRDIYAWLSTLPPPTPTPVATLPPAEATKRARDRFYPLFTAEELLERMESIDESALRVEGVVVAAKKGERYTEIRLRMDKEGEGVQVFALFDTAMARRPFPAERGDRVIVYGIGAKPVEVVEADGTSKRLPRLQILEVVKK